MCVVGMVLLSLVAISILLLKPVEICLLYVTTLLLLISPCVLQICYSAVVVIMKLQPVFVGEILLCCCWLFPS